MVQHAYCDGVRTQSNRQFPDCTPLILTVNVEFLAASGALASESDFPQQIKFLGRRYWYKIFIYSIYLFTELSQNSMKIHSEIEMRCTSDYDYYMIIISWNISFLQPSMFCCLQRIDICPLLLLHVTHFMPSHFMTGSITHAKLGFMENGCIMMN